MEFNGTLPAQVMVSAAGIGLMIGIAYMVDWYERTDRVPHAAAQSEQPR